MSITEAFRGIRRRPRRIPPLATSAVLSAALVLGPPVPSDPALAQVTAPKPPSASQEPRGQPPSAESPMGQERRPRKAPADDADREAAPGDLPDNPGCPVFERELELIV